MIVSVPVRVPTTVGANFTEIVQLFPGARTVVQLLV